MKQYYALNEYKQVVKDFKSFINSLLLTRKQQRKAIILFKSLLKLIATVSKPGIEVRYK